MADATATRPSWAPPLPPGRQIEVPGRGTTFIRELPGPPGASTLVLLHGLSASADLNWFTAYEALGRRFRVIAIDHRGHGRGIRSRRRFRLADCADDAAGVCAQLGIDRFIPVGYSMGGPISLLTWHRHRDRVAGLVLCATAPYFAGNPQQRAMFSVAPALAMGARVTPGTVRRRMAEQLIAGRVGDDAVSQWLAQEFRRGDPASVMEAAGAIGRFDARPWLEHIDVPTAVVRTLEDALVPPRRQTQLATRIPGATLVDVQGNHGVCVADPRRFVPALVRACESVASRARPASRPHIDGRY